jgi:hypothetical protein
LQANIDAEASRAQGAEASITSSVNNEITRATGAEAAEATTRAGADAAEAVARVAGDAASVATANAYTDGAVTTVNNSLATKANLTGGNSFTGDQTVNGSLSLPALASGPSASQAFDMAGADGSNQPTLFRWQVNNTGFLNLATATSGNPPQDSGLKIGSDGKITFAAGQTFPGTQSSLTAGSGISILSTTISNTGVLSFNGRNGGVVPASGDYSFSQISGSITPGQTGAGTYGIDISGNAATATLAASATSAGNASLLSGEAAATAATLSTIAARDASGDLFANVFHGSGASLNNIPTSALPASLVYNNQANIYTAGSKQTFKASATFAGLNVFGVPTDPTGPLGAGDAWFNTTSSHLKFFDGTTTKTVAFGDDSISSAQVSGTYTNAVTFNNASNSFSGSGAGLTALSASNVSTGTLADARLSGNVPLLNGTQTFNGVNTFSSASNSFTGSGANLTALNGSNISTGTLAAARLPLATAATVGAASAPTCSAGQHYSSINGSGALVCSADSVTTNLSFSAVTAGANTGQGSLQVGTGSSLSATGTGTISATSVNGFQVVKLTQSLTPAANAGGNVNGNHCAEQAFTITGLQAADVILSINPPASLGLNLGIGSWRNTGGGTPQLAVNFCNPSSTNQTPPSGNYIVVVLR